MYVIVKKVGKTVAVFEATLEEDVYLMIHNGFPHLREEIRAGRLDIETSDIAPEVDHPPLSPAEIDAMREKAIHELAGRHIGRVLKDMDDRLRKTEKEPKRTKSEFIAYLRGFES